MPRKEITQPGAESGSAFAVWHPLASLHDEMDRLFERYLPREFASEWFRGDGSVNFAQVDFVESDDAFDVMVDVPGMTEKEIDVTLSDNILTIKGERKFETKEKSKDFLRHERSYGAFNRRLSLPCEVQEGKVSAVVHDGILKIHLPKAVTAKTQTKKIAIKAA